MAKAAMRSRVGGFADGSRGGDGGAAARGCCLEFAGSQNSVSAVKR